MATVYDKTAVSTSDSTAWPNKIIIRRGMVNLTGGDPASSLANAVQVQCIKVNAGESVLFAGVLTRTVSGNADAQADLGFNGGNELGSDIGLNSVNTLTGDAVSGAAHNATYFATNNVITFTASNGNTINAGKFEVFAAIMTHYDE
jgi:hypothetical protein